MIDHEYNVKLL